MLTVCVEDCISTFCTCHFNKRLSRNKYRMNELSVVLLLLLLLHFHLHTHITWLKQRKSYMCL